MLRIAICDDDPDFSFQMRSLLERWNNQKYVFSIEEFEDGDSLIKAHKETPFDIIFLDIIMPLFNGIEAAREIRAHDQSSKIIFLTSSPEFAVDSYTVKATNYLLKPIEPEKLFLCLKEVVENITQSARSIIIKSNHATHRIELRNIEYIEAQNKHVLFTLTDGNTVASIDPLYTYTDSFLLADGFFKCHRSYIVNIHQIDSYTSKEIKMHSGFRIPISRTCQHEFESAYFSVFFGKAGDEN